MWPVAHPARRLSGVVRHRAEGYRHVYVEDLHINTMVHHPRLSKSILDASWGMFLDILADKAERTGHEVVRVAPQYTTQHCS